MFSRKAMGAFLSVLLLCQCATKHQPIHFSATYQRFPEDVFSPSTLKACRALESKPNLTLLEKKRLLDLYELEAKHLKESSPRLAEIQEKSEKIRFEVGELIDEHETLKTEIFLERKEPAEDEKNSFQNPDLKKAYSKVAQLWNRDENEQALLKARELTSNPAFSNRSTTAEWIRVLNLQFRIAHDIGNLESIQAAYEKLKGFDECSTETANAALLLALSYFSKQRPSEALSLLERQCDKDDSLTNQARKAYWLYRFQRAIDPKLAEERFQALSRLPLPGYYLYLARSQRGEKFEIPSLEPMASTPYLRDQFVVPAAVSKSLTQAEDRLKAGLNKDASLFLTKALSGLKEEPEKHLLPLLYVAHLFRAAGNHLESMKTFSMLVNGKKSPSSQWSSAIHNEFLEMFPRPFSERVGWLAKEWNVDEDFIYSIMRQESAFNPGAVSPADARGLMQLMPSLARSLSQSWKYQPYMTDRMLFQAEENLKLSSYHLNQLQKIAPHYALMAASYNAGFRRTGRWWQKFGDQPLDIFVEFIPVSETRNYVKLVLRNYLYYKALRTGGVLDPNVIALALPPYTLPRTVSSVRR